MEQTMGQRLAELRKKSGLTQNELAEKLMVSNKAVSKWESDNGNPSMEFLPQLSQILNCSIDYLLTGKEHKNSEFLEINNDYELPIQIGKNDTKTFIGDITTLSHTMILGETGSGKSIFLHNIITELIYHKSPNEINFALLDPKQVEFYYYQNIPYLFKPLAKQQKDITNLLQECVAEMDRRIELIDCINKLNSAKGVVIKYTPDASMPYLLLVIDELYEVVIQSEKNINLLTRLLKSGHEVGIFVFMATQTNDIKNIPNCILDKVMSKISFKVNSSELSKNFIGVPDAANLKLHGEMLFKTKSCLKPYLLKPKYINEQEIKQIIHNLK